MRIVLCLLLPFVASSLVSRAQSPTRLVIFGAHPDDCEADAGGTAALMARLGHAVKFVAVTNGDAGHHEMGGGPLAARRAEEAEEVRRRLGIAEYVILPNSDGLLEPKLDVRLDVIREIRNWKADVVMAPRPNDYHPDHRYTGVLVQDAAYMVGVPNIASDTPPLRKNPVFLYTQDGFQKPAPFRPDIAIDITDTWSLKVDALDANVSQMYEWLPWVAGRSDEVPEGAAERRAWLERQRSPRNEVSSEVRAALVRWYGEKRASEARYAEVFEICEYGSQPSEEEIRKLFPVFAR